MNLEQPTDIDNESIDADLAVGSQEQQEEARQRFWSHAGAISLGYATGVDNESIDADIAKAYADEY